MNLVTLRKILWIKKIVQILEKPFGLLRYGLEITGPSITKEICFTILPKPEVISHNNFTVHVKS